ncbi:uncharacterized protein LOC125349212 [Perognathus longimembris pacificus]|uniref:uncharacterized protein LOC125349212 n=1 Tax=Perognathus longimembris pacificus TaxID=214514 RepID=UPI002019B2D8|nr:uncharacterized protein LOC125349212 [Perognathus longimembris pacificus]
MAPTYQGSGGQGEDPGTQDPQSGAHPASGPHGTDAPVENYLCHRQTHQSPEWGGYIEAQRLSCSGSRDQTWVPRNHVVWAPARTNCQPSPAALMATRSPGSQERLLFTPTAAGHYQATASGLWAWTLRTRTHSLCICPALHKNWTRHEDPKLEGPTSTTSNRRPDLLPSLIHRVPRVATHLPRLSTHSLVSQAAAQPHGHNSIFQGVKQRL